MAKYATFFLELILIFSFCLITSCGEEININKGKSETSDTTDDCSAVGNLLKFEITCKKEIQDFQVDFFTTPDSIPIKHPEKLDLVGKGIDVHIEKTSSKTIRGNVSGLSKPTMAIAVNHKDGSASELTIK